MTLTAAARDWQTAARSPQFFRNENDETFKQWSEQCSLKREC